MTKSIIIEAGKTTRLYWEDMWRFRELLFVLTWRDVAVRYKQTAMGIFWAVLSPLATMVVFTVVFSKVAKLPSEGTTAYPLMVFTAMLPWQLFSSAFSAVSGSMLSNSNLVSRVYCPRLLVPIATLGRPLVDFCISAVLLGGMMCYYGCMPPIQVVATLPLIFLSLLLSLGLGLIIGALAVSYRDFTVVGGYFLRFMLYVSPVGFSSSVVPEHWRAFYDCNPLVGIIDGFRWALLDSVPFPEYALFISLIWSAVLVIVGVSVFRSLESTFADTI